MTRSKLTSEQKALRERVEAAYHKPFGFRYHHPDWNKNLWKGSYREIVEYLEDRFRTTLDEVEYYSSMVYLYHVIPDHELLVEFGDAPQVIEARATYHEQIHEGACKTINQKPTLKETISKIKECVFSVDTVGGFAKVLNYVGEVV